MRTLNILAVVGFTVVQSDNHAEEKLYTAMSESTEGAMSFFDLTVTQTDYTDETKETTYESDIKFGVGTFDWAALETYISSSRTNDNNTGFWAAFWTGDAKTEGN